MAKKIVSVVNQKGGVGKTTTSINLAANIALTGKKTLLIDIDPQANCTSGVGVKKEEITKNVSSIFFEEKTQGSFITKTQYMNLDIIASEIDLVGADIELIDMPDREFIIKKALKTFKNKYDYIIFDCPPSLNLLTVNALTASDSILIPVQCEYFALEGLTQLLKVYDLIKSSLNKSLVIEGFLFTMAQIKEDLTKTVIEDVRLHFKEKVFKTIIHKDITLGQAPSFGSPIIYYSPRSRGAQDYVKFTEEFLTRQASEIAKS